MKKALLMAALAATMFVACNNKGETNVNESVEVKFASHSITTTTTTQTRVIDNEWESGDPIGIFMFAHGTTTVVENAANIAYQASSARVNSAFLSATPINYPQSGENVDFFAYHPYQAGMTNTMYSVNVANQTNQSAIDLMCTNIVDNAGAGFSNTFTSAVNLHFYHKLVKLNLTVVKGAGTSDLGGLQVAINGMKTAASYDIQGMIGVPSAPAVIVPLETRTPSATIDGKYEAILLPVSAFDASHTITFTIGTDVYTLQLTNLPNNVTSFVSGSKYDYNVTLSKHGVQISGTIEPWNTGDSNGVVAY